MIANKFEKWIYKWVADNYGASEADDPSWDIRALAEELNKHIYEIYRDVEHRYLVEDCKYIAEQNNIELSDKQVDAVVNEFVDCDAYVDAHTEDWLYFMGLIKKGEEKWEERL